MEGEAGGGLGLFQFQEMWGMSFFSSTMEMSLYFVDNEGHLESLFAIG